MTLTQYRALTILDVQQMHAFADNVFTITRNRFGKPMPPPKYQFSRPKWHKATMWKSDKRTSDIDAWCTENFGPQPTHPDAWSRWSRDIVSTYYFRDEKDYILFVLRWS